MTTRSGYWERSTVLRSAGAIAAFYTVAKTREGLSAALLSLFPFFIHALNHGFKFGFLLGSQHRAHLAAGFLPHTVYIGLGFFPNALHFGMRFADYVVCLLTLFRRQTYFFGHVCDAFGATLRLTHWRIRFRQHRMVSEAIAKNSADCGTYQKNDGQPQASFAK